MKSKHNCVNMIKICEKQFEVFNKFVMKNNCYMRMATSNCEKLSRIYVNGRGVVQHCRGFFTGMTRRGLGGGNREKGRTGLKKENK